MRRVSRWLEQEAFPFLIGTLAALCLVAAALGCGGKSSKSVGPGLCARVTTAPTGQTVTVWEPCPSPIPKPTPEPQPNPCWPPRDDCPKPHPP